MSSPYNHTITTTSSSSSSSFSFPRISSSSNHNNTVAYATSTKPMNQQVKNYIPPMKHSIIKKQKKSGHVGAHVYSAKQHEDMVMKEKERNSHSQAPVKDKSNPINHLVSAADTARAAARNSTQQVESRKPNTWTTIGKSTAADTSYNLEMTPSPKKLPGRESIKKTTNESATFTPKKVAEVLPSASVPIRGTPFRIEPMKQHKSTQPKPQIKRGHVESSNDDDDDDEETQSQEQTVNNNITPEPQTSVLKTVNESLPSGQPVDQIVRTAPEKVVTQPGNEQVALNTTDTNETVVNQPGNEQVALNTNDTDTTPKVPSNNVVIAETAPASAADPSTPATSNNSEDDRSNEDSNKVQEKDGSITLELATPRQRKISKEITLKLDDLDFYCDSCRKLDGKSTVLSNRRWHCTHCPNFDQCDACWLGINRHVHSRKTILYVKVDGKWGPSTSNDESALSNIDIINSAKRRRSVAFTGKDGNDTGKESEEVEKTTKKSKPSLVSSAMNDESTTSTHTEEVIKTTDQSRGSSSSSSTIAKRSKDAFNPKDPDGEIQKIQDIHAAIVRGEVDPKIVRETRIRFPHINKTSKNSSEKPNNDFEDRVEARMNELEETLLSMQEKFAEVVKIFASMKSLNKNNL